jgi:hypothetical protein
MRTGAAEQQALAVALLSRLSANEDNHNAMAQAGASVEALVEVGNICHVRMTQSVQLTPPLIPQQQVRGIIDAERSQDSLRRDCDRLASMMPRNCCGNTGDARVTNCVIWNVH